MIEIKKKDLNLVNINHKVAIISGGTGRIGSIFTILLLNSGCKVISLSRSKDKFLKFKKKIKYNQKNLIWHNLDLNNEESIKNAADIIKIKYKKLDLIINNASSSNRGENVTYNFKNIFNEFMSASGGSIFFTEKLIPLLRKNKNCKIINVGSLWGFRSPKQKIYGKLQIGPSLMTAASKSAIINYTKYLAVREAKYSIIANSLSPGWFPRKGPIENKKYIRQIKHNIPLNRIGCLSDLISPISFLLSDGSRYFTGQNLVIDGGYSAW